MPRSTLKMLPIWYGGDDAQPPVQPKNDAPVAWMLTGYSGVRGFYDLADITGKQGSSGRRDLYDWLENDYNIKQQVKSLAADVSAMGGSAGDIYQQDYRVLPYQLRKGEMQVLSRWNMERQSPYVSRIQCKVRVKADGTALLTSCGKAPTLIRAWGGEWNWLHTGERHVLAHGDQVGLDWQEPEAAVFTCEAAAAAEQGYAEQEYAPGLPDGWATGIDEASGAAFYYNEYTGVSQWERPEHEYEAGGL